MARDSMMPAAAVLAALTLGGCGDLDLPVVVESAHFRVHAHDDDWICPRIGERLEGQYTVIGNYLGVALLSGTKIDVYKLRDADELSSEAPCQPHAAGCADDLSVYVSSLAALEHELVHAYASLIGHPPRLFEEGWR